MKGDRLHFICVILCIIIIVYLSIGGGIASPQNNDPTLKLEIQMQEGQVFALPIHQTYIDYNFIHTSETKECSSQYNFTVNWGDNSDKTVVNLLGSDNDCWNTDETSIFSGYIKGFNECLENNDITKLPEKTRGIAHKFNKS